MNANIFTDMTISLLPLDTFREIAGVTGYHFWGFRDPLAIDGADECDVPWLHYRWLLRKGVGRFDMLTALAKAESRMADILDYWPFAKYDNEKITLQRPRPYVSYRQPQITQLKWGHIQAIGDQTWQSLQAGAVPVYGATDDVTIVVALASTVDVDEVVVCYPGTQVPIRPIYCTLAGLNLTITIKKWLLGNPNVWTQRVTDNTVMKDPTDMANMLATVDVYRVYVDDSDIHVTFDEHGTCDNTDCAKEQEGICVSYIDKRAPLFKWYPKEDTFWTHYRPPESISLNYTHGLNHTNYGSYMSWALVVSHFAIALLDDVGCDCKEADFCFRYWQEDLAHADEGGSTALSAPRLGNPFGTKRGAIEAWEFVRTKVGS